MPGDSLRAQVAFVGNFAGVSPHPIYSNPSNRLSQFSAHGPRSPDSVEAFLTKGWGLVLQGEPPCFFDPPRCVGLLLDVLRASPLFGPFVVSWTSVVVNTRPYWSWVGVVAPTIAAE